MELERSIGLTLRTRAILRHEMEWMGELGELEEVGTRMGWAGRISFGGTLRTNQVAREDGCHHQPKAPHFQAQHSRGYDDISPETL